VFQIDIETWESHAFANPLCSTNLAPPIPGPDPHNEPDPPFRSLSGSALAYCAYGKSALFPLFFFKQVHYSPQSTEKMDSISHNARYDRLSPTDS